MASFESEDENLEDCREDWYSVWSDISSKWHSILNEIDKKTILYSHSTQLLFWEKGHQSKSEFSQLKSIIDIERIQSIYREEDFVTQQETTLTKFISMYKQTDI